VVVDGIKSVVLQLIPEYGPILCAQHANAVIVYGYNMTETQRKERCMHDIVIIAVKVHIYIYIEREGEKEREKI
jgi:hypothetical protein